MAGVSLKSLLRAKSADPAPVAALLAAMEGPLAIEDAAGSVLWGTAGIDGTCIPVVHGDTHLGCVRGPNASAKAAGALLQHLAGKESERRALANEVLHLYREVHLIDQLSEELTALFDVCAA